MSLRVPASCRPGDMHKTERAYTEIVEEYVEGVYRLKEALGTVSTGDLAEYMCVSAGSVTSMLKKLKQQGLVEYEKYKGVTLTPMGEKLAKQLSRAHRILKRFLVDIVGLPWNDVHELACKLEHYISPDVIEQMYERLGRPEKCPHGTPIDTDVDDKSFRLMEANVGDCLKVVKVTNERYEFLRFLEEIGLLPEVEFEAVGATEFDGLIHLKIGGKPITVGREVSRHVWVHRCPPKKAQNGKGKK